MIVFLLENMLKKLKKISKITALNCLLINILEQQKRYCVTKFAV